MARAAAVPESGQRGVAGERPRVAGAAAAHGGQAEQAVLAPADTEYRYFVAKGGGRHTFSADYADHLQAIEALRRKRP